MVEMENDILNLENTNIPRCYKPNDFGEKIDYTLHHFSDASEKGYGQASYLRMKNEYGRIWCCLVFGKSRVAPLKYVSIPRLELTAATLSVKISNMLKEEMDIQITSETFWTDSQVVLGYINSECRRFKVFVANRAQFIRDHTDIQQWRYVSTHENPADDASRGLRSTDLEKIKRWFNGPFFLWQPEETWLCRLQSIEPLADRQLNY